MPQFQNHSINCLSVDPGVDYEHLQTGLLRFDACQMRACLNINTLGDDCPSEGRDFSVVLEEVTDGRTEGTAFVLEPAEAIISIIDDDGKWPGL